MVFLWSFGNDLAKKETRTYSRYADEAIKLLARRIKVARIERGITTQELSERADISRGLLRRIENGDPACGIGVVFEVATLLGLELFSSEYDDLVFKNKLIADKLILLPRRIRKPNIEIDDNF